MPSSTTSRPAPASPASPSHTSPISFRHRRDSINSISTSSVVGREQLASALDQIHSSASQTDALTTFNDFAPPPKASPGPEGKGNAASEMVQNGLSGLYTRFREAVGVTSPNKAVSKEDDATTDVGSKRTSTAGSHVSRPSASSLHRIDTIIPSSPTSSQPTPKSELSSSGVLTVFPSESRPPTQSTKPGTKGSTSGTKSSSSSRPSLTARTKSSATLDPTIAPVTAHRDPSRSTTRTDNSAGQDSSRKSISKGDLQSHLSPADQIDARNTRRSRRDDASSYDGSVDAAPLSPAKGLAPSPMPPLTRNHARSPSESSSVLLADGNRRTPAVIDRISHPRSPVYPRSRESSMDRGPTETSHISTSAHGSVYHDSFSQDDITSQKSSRDPRTSHTAATLEGASEQMNAQLERMRRQVLSKEIWMKDDTVKECFACQTPFSAFRRKHHCRTCGCIFDSKCTTVVSGERFGVQGNLRVCKRCLEAINRRYDDGSGSDDSGDDEQSFLPRIFGGGQKSVDQHAHHFSRDPDMGAISEGSEDSRLLSTPMMAIPATRRVNESNRNSAILEIDAGPQLSRPGSSRSLKSLATARPQSSAGHKRHHSKHGFLGRFKPQQEDRAPFRKGVEEDDPKKPKFPAFHDDNIIDPELADFMSDDSSGDEQISIFATMGTADLQSATFDNDKTSLSPFVNASRKYKHRAGEKSLSGISYLSRDDTTGPPSAISYRRNTRRRNLSNVSGSVYHVGSPRPKSAIYKGPSASTDMLQAMEHQLASGAHLTRSDSLQKKRVTKTELNNSSVRHVDKLLHQLLVDALIPNAAAWQKALVPILLQCTDDVSPDVANGEDMDIRHYVKLKRIPGGKPGDTIYTSGVVFTKNLALKSMPRRISNPRIVLVTFPIEYQRHQQHFMSLQPVIEQEKEFLRVVVQRITNLRPHVLLAEKGVSGVALQYLSEANISVAYNVKHTVIEAVARCAETEIISSLDRLALPVRVGRCSGFDVRTFVNNDHPGRKKSYIFFSGCRPDLGCTIALRGANSGLLAKVKYIMEFMVYVVYNLKLESSLLQDESIEPPEGDSSSLNSGGAANDSFRSLNNSVGSIEGPRIGPQMIVQQPSGEGESAFEIGAGGAMTKSEEAPGGIVSQRPKLVSLHESHGRASQDGHVPDDVPMPTFYSDMVAKYETKILSASPYVKFTQPYLLMKAREQERRLLYLRRLRDQDVIEEQGDPEKQEPAKFQLIKPELVEELGQKAPRQIMEILHAVHDAEYDKALFNYQTQTRQWETYIQGNLDLFDPFSHQNIVVLYSEICTDTKIPCTEPSLVAINFYDEQHVYTGMDPDCTLGQYIQDLAESKDRTCESSGCERKLVEHHRTYVHDQSRVTIFVERAASGAASRPDLGEGITMWTYCKICKKDSEESAMSDATFKYSFGKYLELLYWGRGLRMKSNLNCPHDHHMDHVRYFSLDDARIRIHLDPIDLLEIVVPRTRITWKVVNDLKLKNEIFSKVESRWKKFMDSVTARLGGIRIDSVLPEKAEKCQAEVDLMKQKAQEERPALVQKLQDIYVNSKYYEVVPFNSLVREMVERAGEWDEAFNKFERDFLNDTDMRQLTIQQLKKIFTDDESKDALVTTEGTASTADSEDRASQTFTEAGDRPTQPTEYTENDMDSSAYSKATDGSKHFVDDGDKVHIPAEGAIERVEPLDLAGSPTAIVHPIQQEQTSSEPISEISSSDTPVPSRPDVSPTGPDRSATEPSLAGQSLSDKIHQMRREYSRQSPQASELSSNEEMRQTSIQSSSRVSDSSTSPPLVRATSHPSRALTRTQSSLGKQTPAKDSKVSLPDTTATQREGSIKVDKKLSDRLGLTALKNRSKGTTSNIPRLIKKKESKVSTLARHFEQLSREFEKERIRKRASSMRHHHTMLPRASTKATVHVYEDVQEAFAEAPPQNELDQERRAESKAKIAPATEVHKSEQSTEPPTPAEPASRTSECQQAPEPDSATSLTASQAGSDDEDGETEHSVPAKYLPEIEDLAEKLEPTDIPLELPKDQKTSLMKYLTTFWAERSASGWPALEYPVNPTDHIFVDSNIIVREDEPSSVIALALNSDDYQDKLGHIRREAQEIILRESDGGGNESDAKSVLRSDTSEILFEETDLEKSLLRVTGTHLKYQFKEGAAVMTCKIFYAEQFDALRRKCGVAERIVESLSRCLKWDSKGGKTKSVFLKTLDDRLILKSLSPIETSAFLRFAPGYFNIMAEALFHDLPSVIAKMLGFFQVIIKNPVTGTDIKLDLLITENLFYDRSPSRIFDLKGSMRNRKIESTGEQNEVLLDENMVEYIYESPLFAREHSKKLLRASVWNDTLFLARQNVMDYSLMIAVDEPRKELVVGIIDCIRTYTWDKKLESWIKDRGFAGGGRNRPTVTSPKEYKSRFREAMARYILQSPNCWHLFNNPQYPMYYGRARFEEQPETVQ